MENIPYELRAGQLNQTFEKIKNCRVVKPTYDPDGFYSAEFMLDKRLGLKEVFADTTKNFLDYIDIKGIRYYYYTTSGKGYIGTLNSGVFTNITPDGFLVDNNSPKKIAYGRNIYGPKQSSGVVATPQVGIGGSFPVQGMDDYTGGYVKFTYTGTTGIVIGDYLVFKGATSVLKGALNRVEYIEGGYIYIIGTNARGSIPKVGDTFDVYKGTNSVTSNCIMIGHNGSDGKGTVSMALLNGHSAANIIEVITCDEKIIDLINFDANLFALTDTRMYFSRSTIDDNTQFYPLDNYKIDGGEKMFPMGKALMVFARQNKLFAAANATTQNIGYVGYDVNYNGNAFSKYSIIFSDQTIYILQEDQQLMQVDIVQSNSTTFDLVIKNILLNTRGIFEDIVGGDVNISSGMKHLNFVYVKNGNSTNYEFDKSYQHWILNEYEGITINKFSDHILGDGFISEVNTTDTDGTEFTDMGTEYEQQVNFSLNGGIRMNMPYMIRTIFGMVDSILDVKLDMAFEIGGKSIPKQIVFNNLDIDNRFNTTPTGDTLIGYDTLPEVPSEYNGNTVSLQSSILKT